MSQPAHRHPPRREQGHVFQHGCAGIVPDVRLKVRVRFSRQRLGLDVLRRHFHKPVEARTVVMLRSSSAFLSFSPRGLRFTSTHGCFTPGVEDPALALRVERLVTVDPQSGLGGDDFVVVESGPDVDQDVEEKCGALLATCPECSTFTAGPRPGDGLLVLPMRVLLLVAQLLVLAKPRRLDPGPAHLGVHQHTKPNHPPRLRNRVSRGARLLMSQCPSHDMITSMSDRRLVVLDAVWGAH
jgi:hypothetical protein